VPAHVVAFPVSASAINLVDGDGEKYSVTLDTDTFDRAGEDGDIPVLPLNGGDEFVGEALEGQWHKGWDANIDTFTATIDSGTLRLTGVAKVAGTGGNGWINSHHPAPLLDGLEYTVSLEVPVDDTGGTANRDIKLAHFIKQDKDELQPDSDNNYLQIEVDVDENGLTMYLRKEVNGVNTTLDSGYDYTMDGTRSTGNLEATIWRLVFNGKPGTAGATLSVYLKQSDSLANAETATEHELDGSPYDISDLAFVIGYPSYRIYTENATYFGATYDSANRAASTYLRVNYDNSPFKIHYDFTPADYGEGDVELWDGDPDSGGVRVYDEDHEFANDPYLQNGLVRVHIDEGVQFGPKLFYWTGVAWNQPFTLIYPNMNTDNKTAWFLFLKQIKSISPEKVSISVRMEDTAVEDSDFYVDMEITLERGKYYLKFGFESVHPSQEITFVFKDSARDRFGYVCDNAIGDVDLLLSATNTTLTDNFLLMFDDMGSTVIGTMWINEKPDGVNKSFITFKGADLSIKSIAIVDQASTEVYLGFVPFSLVANLFEEAEDATLGGGATAAADAGASGGQAALLDAQNELVYYDITAGTDLPAGNYLVVWRARDTNQVAGDFSTIVVNTTDGANRNEYNATTSFTVTASYAYYSTFFFITDADVTGIDNIRIRVIKSQAGANNIYVDYFLIVPIGNGMNWSQDLAHSALRGVTQLPRLCER